MTSAARVVSLVPSATETLRAWGLDPVACTRFCEQPDLPAVGGTKDPDVAAITALAPDLVVVDEEENREEDADALVAAGLHVHVLAVRALSDVGPQLRALAARLDVDAGPLVDFEPPSPPTIQRRVFVPIWRRPWMTIGGDTYGSSLLAAVGLDNIYAGEPSRYPEVTLDDATDRRPDAVLAPSEPYPFGPRHVAELEAVAQVELVDGRDLFWWGARTPRVLTVWSSRLR